MTKQEAIDFIIKNKDKSTYELKRMLKDKMTLKQRKKFTSEHLFELIAEANKKNKKNYTSEGINDEIQKLVNNKRKAEGRDR